MNCDVIITIGTIEPHLYAGFSGGVKCIGVGAAGKETILYTHSVSFLKKKGVKLTSIKTNLFQRFLWKIQKLLNKKTYSLNIVNNYRKEMVFVSFAKAENSFNKAISFMKKHFSNRIKNKFDILFIGCDSPKERSFYQVSRLYNYVIDRVSVIRKGGGDVCFC